MLWRPPDQADAAALAHALWPLCERVSARLKQASLAGQTITLKLKTADFRLPTRSHRLADPTQLAQALFRTAAALLASEADGITRFRLIGVGTDALVEDLAADPPTLFDRELDRPRRIERAMDQVRTRVGDESVWLGRGLSASGTTPLRRSKVGWRKAAEWSAVRLNERLDIVQLGTDRVVAVVDQHVLRNSVVEKAHTELVLWLFDAGIRREESEPDAPAGPLQ